MRESASFVPNVDALKIVFCHTCVLIKKQCPFLKHISVCLRFISTGKMLETPGARQMALLSVQQSFAVALIHTTAVHVHHFYSNITVFPDQRLPSLTYLGCA